MARLADAEIDMDALRRFATVATLIALLPSAPAHAQKSKPVLNLECTRPDGAKWFLSFDLRAEKVRYRFVASDGSSDGWQGPLSVNATHSDGAISWFSSEEEWRTQWIVYPSKDRLTIGSATGGGCCAKSPIQWRSYEARCSAAKSNMSLR
jgi:hypothetical protein